MPHFGFVWSVLPCTNEIAGLLYYLLTSTFQFNECRVCTRPSIRFRRYVGLHLAIQYTVLVSLIKNVHYAVKSPHGNEAVKAYMGMSLELSMGMRLWDPTWEMGMQMYSIGL